MLFILQPTLFWQYILAFNACFSKIDDILMLMDCPVECTSQNNGVFIGLTNYDVFSCWYKAHLASGFHNTLSGDGIFHLKQR